MKPFHTPTPDKKRPIEERIAAGMGKSAYVDLRDGVGGTNPLKLTDQDIYAALGIVSDRLGRLSAQVLETYYGSTLIHQAAMQRAWEDQERKPGDTREQIVLTRFAGALAIRALAGSKFTNASYAEYAYLIFSRRTSLQQRVHDATAWLEGVRATALAELRKTLRDRDALDAFMNKSRRPRAAAHAS